MSGGDPIEFTRKSGGIKQRCENQVVLTDEDGNVINAANPLDVDASGGGEVEADVTDRASRDLGSVDIADITRDPVTCEQSSASASGDNTLVAAPGAGKKYEITKLTIQLEAQTATLAILKCSSRDFQRIYMVEEGDGITEEYHPMNCPETGEDEAIVLNLDGANQVGWTLHYREVDA